MEVSHFESLSLAYWVALALLAATLLVAWWRRRGQHRPDLDNPSVTAGFGDVLLIIGLTLLNGLTYVVGEGGASAGEGKAAVITTAQVVGSSMMQVQFAVLLVLYLRLVRGLSPVTFLGLRSRSFMAVLGWSAGGLLVTGLLMNAAMQGWWHGVLGTSPPEDSDQVIVQAFQQSKDVGLRLSIIVAAGLVAPVVEELVYRGLIYGFARSLIGHWPAALLSSAIFALVHVDAVASLPLFVLALGLATAYDRSRSLWVPVLMHMLFNAWNLAAMLMKPV
jgi:membrane protease YdiL (CAAX protease family)